MHKRFLFAFLFIVAAGLAIYFFSQPKRDAPLPQSESVQPAPSVAADDELRAVWVNYNELSMKSLGGGTEEDFKNKAEEMCRNIRAWGDRKSVV